MSKAQQFAEVSYDLVCLAKGKKSLDASRVANLRCNLFLKQLIPKHNYLLISLNKSGIVMFFPTFH